MKPSEADEEEITLQATVVENPRETDNPTEAEQPATAQEENSSAEQQAERS